MTALSVAQVAERWLTAKEAAAHCRVSVGTFRAYVAAGKYPQGYSSSPRRRVWSATDLNKALTGSTKAPVDRVMEAILKAQSSDQRSGIEIARDEFQADVLAGRCVYFIAANKLIKIGTSANVLKRMEQMQTGSGDLIRLIAVIPGANSKIESEIHAILHKQRHHGEWFSLPRLWHQRFDLPRFGIILASCIEDETQ